MLSRSNKKIIQATSGTGSLMLVIAGRDLRIITDFLTSFRNMRLDTPVLLYHELNKTNTKKLLAFNYDFIELRSEKSLKELKGKISLVPDGKAVVFNGKNLLVKRSAKQDADALIQGAATALGKKLSGVLLKQQGTSGLIGFLALDNSIPFLIAERTVSNKEYEKALKLAGKNGLIKFNLAENAEIAASVNSKTKDEVIKLKQLLGEKNRQLEFVKTELGENKKLYKAIFDHSLSALLLGKPDGTILEVNKAACDMFGYTPEEFNVIGRSGFVDVSSESALSKIKERTENGKASGEFIGIRKNGDRFPCQVSSVIFRDSNGEERTSTTIVDISEIKKHEKVTQETLHHMQMILDNTEEAFFILDTNLRLITFNNTARKRAFTLIGKEFQVGESILSYSTPDRISELKKMYSYILEGNDFEYKYEIKEPGHAVLGFKFTPVKDDKGKVYAIVMNARDITAEEYAKRSYEFNVRNTAALINSTTDLIWSIDKEKRLVLGNNSFLKFIEINNGVRLKPGISLIKENKFVKSQRDEWSVMYDRVLRGESFSAINSVEANNEIVWSETYFDPIIENGEIIGAAMYSRNITDKFKLDSQRALYESIVNFSEDAIISKKLDGTITSWNKGAEKLFGYTASETIGKNIAFLFPEEKSNTEKGILEKIAGGFYIEHYETERKRKDGTIVSVSLTVSPIADNTGKIIGASKIARDITERKRAEEQIQKSFKEISDYKFALNESSIVAITDDKGTITYANENFCKISKYSREELIGNTHRLVNSGHHSPEFFKDLWKTIGNGKVWRGEVKNKAKDGSIYWVDTTIVPFLNDGGKPYQFIAIRNDITTRKNAEEKMLESNERFEYVTKATFDAIWDWNLITDHIYWGHGFETLFGYNRSQQNTDIFSWYDRIHKDDKQRVIKRIQSILGGNELNWTEEYRFEKFNGEFSHVMDKGIIIRNAEGKAIRMIGAMQDITQQKTEEMQLKLFKSVVTNASDGVLILDPGTKENQPAIVYANESFAYITGYSENEVVGKDLGFLTGIKSDKIELNRLKKAMASWQPFETEIVSYRKNGEEFWNNFSVVPITDEKGNYSNWICILRDVTLYKKLNEEKRRILESISDCFYVLDNEMNLTFMNSAAEKLLQVTAKDYMGKNLWNMYPHLKGTIFQEKMDEAVATKTSRHFEFFNDEHQSWYDESFFPSEDGVSVFFRSVDQRKKAEELLKTTLEEKNSILESFGDGFFALDDEWKVTYWNHVAEKMSGVKRDDIINKDFRLFFGKPENEKFIKQYEIVMNTKTPVHFVEMFVQEKVWVEESAYPRPNGISVFFKDVTHRIEAERKLSQLNEELKKRAEELSNSNAELEQFAYVASHDLQEPLRMVSSFLQLLQKKYQDELDETGNKYIYYAVDGAERMKSLIFDLLQYSRVGTATIERNEIDMNALVEDVLVMYKNRDAEFHIDKLPVIMAGKTAISQVLQNLIGNAIKYSKQGKAVVRISSEENSEEWKFIVEDNGIGIDPKFFDKIFIVFQRLHSKGEYSGTGIGLAICKKIIERYKGKIWVESEPGKGSKFIFTIPKNS